MMRTKQIIYDKLKEVARARGLIYYQQVGNLVGLDMGDPRDRDRISQLLDDINEEEATVHQRPMLSAIVVREAEGTPGQGFWKCAKRLGRYTGGSKLDFYCKELQRVYDAARP